MEPIPGIHTALLAAPPPRSRIAFRDRCGAQMPRLGRASGGKRPCRDRRACTGARRRSAEGLLRTAPVRVRRARIALGRMPTFMSRPQPPHSFQFPDRYFPSSPGYALTICTSGTCTDG